MFSNFKNFKVNFTKKIFFANLIREGACAACAPGIRAWDYQGFVCARSRVFAIQFNSIYLYTEGSKQK
jgi:hypothetical protein